MKAYIALLRAVNLGPHNKVSMTALRQFAAEVGLGEPRTLLQSGNLVFRSRKSAAALESLLETEARKRLGLVTDFFVRDVDTWDAMIAANPFPKAAREPSRFVVVPLRKTPDDEAITALKDSIKGREVVEVLGREAYIVYRDGIGRSKLTIGVIESKLGTRGTARNWNTVLKLAALAKE